MSTACDILWDLVYGKDLVSTFSRLTSWPTDKLFPDAPSIKEKATCEKFEAFDTKRAMKGGSVKGVPPASMLDAGNLIRLAQILQMSTRRTCG